MTSEACSININEGTISVSLWYLTNLLTYSACNCNTFGSYSRQCNYTTGECSCKPDIRGIQCDRCAENMVGFPACIKCDCNADGTRFLPGFANGMCYGSAKVSTRNDIARINHLFFSWVGRGGWSDCWHAEPTRRVFVFVWYYLSRFVRPFNSVMKLQGLR